MPVGRTRYTARDIVDRLMAGRARHGGGATIVRAPSDPKKMPVPVIALFRIVDTGVAIETPRVHQHGRDAAERLLASGAPVGVLCIRSTDRGHDEEEREECSCEAGRAPSPTERVGYRDHEEVSSAA